MHLLQHFLNFTFHPWKICYCIELYLVKACSWQWKNQQFTKQKTSTVRLEKGWDEATELECFKQRTGTVSARAESSNYQTHQSQRVCEPSLLPLVKTEEWSSLITGVDDCPEMSSRCATHMTGVNQEAATPSLEVDKWGKDWPGGGEGTRGKTPSNLIPDRLVQPHWTWRNSL